MVKPHWGHRRQCQKCPSAFYDMNRTPIICPSCHARYDEVLAKKQLETLNDTTSKEHLKKSKDFNQFDHEDDAYSFAHDQDDHELEDAPRRKPRDSEPLDF